MKGESKVIRANNICTQETLRCDTIAIIYVQRQILHAQFLSRDDPYDDKFIHSEKANA